MNFLKHLFETVSFTSYLPDINPEIMNIGERGQRTNNTNSMKLLSTIYCTVYCSIWIYLTGVQICFLCNFGKQFFSKKKMYLKDGWGVLTFKICSGNFLFSLNLKADFKDYVPPPLHFHLLQNVFLRFSGISPALQDASYVLGTAEDQAFQMSSTVICNMVIFYKFVVCRQSKFCFLMANLCCSFFHYFFFSFRIIQRIFMLRNKSFIVYCTVLITITNVQDIKEP